MLDRHTQTDGRWDTAKCGRKVEAVNKSLAYAKCQNDVPLSQALGEGKVLWEEMEGGEVWNTHTHIHRHVNMYVYLCCVATLGFGGMI